MDNIDDIDLPETETVKGGKNFWANLFRTILGITISISAMAPTSTTAPVSHHPWHNHLHPSHLRHQCPNTATP